MLRSQAGGPTAWTTGQGSIYLGDPAVVPSDLAGATIVVQSRNGQSWTTTVTAVLDRNSGRSSSP